MNEFLFRLLKMPTHYDIQIQIQVFAQNEFARYLELKQSFDKFQFSVDRLSVRRSMKMSLFKVP